MCVLVRARVVRLSNYFWIPSKRNVCCCHLRKMRLADIKREDQWWNSHTYTRATCKCTHTPGHLILTHTRCPLCYTTREETGNQYWLIYAVLTNTFDKKLSVLFKKDIMPNLSAKWRKISTGQYPAGVEWWMIHKWLSKRGEELLIILLPLVEDEHLHMGIWTSIHRERGEKERRWRAGKKLRMRHKDFDIRNPPHCLMASYREK